jgi:ketosteroid isomerase-like protein
MMPKLLYIQTLLSALCVVSFSGSLHGAEDAAAQPDEAAQPEEAAQADEADQADHAALRELVKVYEQTIQESKPELLKPYLADDFTGVMVTAEEVNSFASLDEYWQKIQGLLGQGGTYQMKVNVPQPAQIVGDLAYAHGTTDDVAKSSAGNEYRFVGHWTAICRKGEGGWKIVRIHGSMDPIGNTFVATAVKSASYTAAATGGVMGAILGCIATLLLRRRPANPTLSPN